jgi:hypothetical protein
LVEFVVVFLFCLFLFPLHGFGFVFVVFFSELIRKVTVILRDVYGTNL